MQKRFCIISVMALALSLTLLFFAYAQETGVSQNTAVTDLKNETVNHKTNSEFKKNLYLLKTGETKPLIGFSLGDLIDYSLVAETNDYFEGGQIHKLREGEYKDIFLFFETYPERKLTGLVAEGACNFFGIVLGETNLKTVSDILGQPDAYEEKDEVRGLPLVVYYFEKSSLYLFMDSKHRIISITYKANLGRV